MTGLGADRTRTGVRLGKQTKERIASRVEVEVAAPV